MASFAQRDLHFKKSSPSHYCLGLNYDIGKVVVHTKALNALEGANPFGLGLEISKQAQDQSTYNLCGGYPRKGLKIQYYNYGSPILGKHGSLSYFIQPSYRLSNRLYYSFRASIGISYSDNPFDPYNRQDTLNQAYSLRYNPYLALSSSLGISLSKKFSIECYGNFNHISNGNINRPNRGLNWATASLELIYHPQGSAILPKRHRDGIRNWKSKPILKTITAFYVARQDYAGYSMGYQRLNAYGLDASLTKQIGQVHGFTLGTQAYYNHLALDPYDSTAPFHENKRSSLLMGAYIGHTFLMGRVRFTQTIGRYLTKHPDFYTPYFHQHTFCYLLNEHWMPGFSLRAHEADADFISLNLTYQF